MHTPLLSQWVFVFISLGFFIWVILRSNRARKDAALRTASVRETSQKNFDLAMANSDQQIALLKELVAEVKLLRKAVEGKD